MTATDRTCHGPDRVWIGDGRGQQGLQDFVRARVAGKPIEDRQQVAEDVALVARARQVDEAQIQAAVALLTDRVVPEQTGAPIVGQVATKRVKQRVEVMMGFVPLRQFVQALHAIPQRVAVQHETRARHEHEQDDAADDRNERQEQPPAAAVRVVQSTDSDRQIGYERR